MLLNIFSGSLLWDIAIKTANEKNEKTSEDANSEKNLLFLGCRESVCLCRMNVLKLTLFEMALFEFKG